MTRSLITSLLMTLQREQGLALLCISHDLEFLAEFAPEIAVMHRGSIVEQGTTVRRFIPEAVLEQHSDQEPPGATRAGGRMSVLRFVLRKLAYGAVITLGVSVLTFAMLELAPGEFFDDLKLDATVGSAHDRDAAPGARADRSRRRFATGSGWGRWCAATSASPSRTARRSRRCSGSARATRSFSLSRRCSSRG